MAIIANIFAVVGIQYLLVLLVAAVLLQTIWPKSVKDNLINGAIIGCSIGASLLLFARYDGVWAMTIGITAALPYWLGTLLVHGVRNLRGRLT